MAAFDFITDDNFRNNLEADYKELDVCLKGKAWKAVLVLSGSIVEAILVDALIAVDYKKTKKSDPLKMKFSDVIDASHDEKTISTRSKDLSSVIRDYRNLIHPGRMVRLKETVTEDEAVIAKSLIKLIRNEVAASRRESFGLTATQLLSKILQDSSSEAILSHLLEDVRDPERKRLLIEIIPRKAIELEPSEGYEFYDEYDQQENLAVRSRLHRCYRIVLDIASDDIKKEVAKSYVDILKSGAENEVSVYSGYLFKCLDLAYLSEQNVDLVKDHVLSRLEKDADNNLDLVEGIEAHLSKSDAVKWIDSLAKIVTSPYSVPSDVKRISNSGIIASWNLKKDAKESVIRRLNIWKTHYEGKDMTEIAVKIDQLKTDIEGDLPF